MIIKGNDLIVSADGKALAASKSCTIEVSADTIEVSDPNDGEWTHQRTGRKKWKVTTSHLVTSPHFTLLKAVAGSYSRGDNPHAVIGNQTIFQSDDNGFYVAMADMVDGKWILDDWFPIATEQSSDIEEAFIDFFNDNPFNGYAYAIYSVGTRYYMTELMAEAMSLATGIDIDDIPQDNETDICIAVTGVGGQSFSIVSAYESGCECQIWLGDDGSIITETAVKDRLMKVGDIVSLRIAQRNMPIDVVTGNAICTKCKISAARGNLVQGSFEWEGAGPLG